MATSKFSQLDKQCNTFVDALIVNAPDLIREDPFPQTVKDGPVLVTYPSSHTPHNLYPLIVGKSVFQFLTTFKTSQQLFQHQTLKELRRNHISSNKRSFKASDDSKST